LAEQQRQPLGAINPVGEDKRHRRIIDECTRQHRRDPLTVLYSTGSNHHA
jgi:hypothetical protein